MPNKLQEIISQLSEQQKIDYDKMHPLAKKEYERRLLIKGCPPAEIMKFKWIEGR